MTHRGPTEWNCVKLQGTRVQKRTHAQEPVVHVRRGWWHRSLRGRRHREAHQLTQPVVEILTYFSEFLLGFEVFQAYSSQSFSFSCWDQTWVKEIPSGKVNFHRYAFACGGVPREEVHTPLRSVPRCSGCTKESCVNSYACNILNIQIFLDECNFLDFNVRQISGWNPRTFFLHEAPGPKTTRMPVWANYPSNEWITSSTVD